MANRPANVVGAVGARPATSAIAQATSRPPTTVAIHERSPVPAATRAEPKPTPTTTSPNAAPTNIHSAGLPGRRRRAS